MTQSEQQYLEVDTRGPVLVVHLNGGPHALMGKGMADALDRFLDRAEADRTVKAVVFTGSHPERFIGHADVAWLQEGGKRIPRVGQNLSSFIARLSALVRKFPLLAFLAARTPLEEGRQLDKLHETFLRMNRSGLIFIAAVNGSALGLGSEFAQAHDVRLMADGDFLIGQPEILLGINPGGGGTQRLTRLVGTHRALMMMLEGRPLSPAKAMEIGLIDEVLPPDALLARAVELANHLGARPRGAIAAIKRAAYFGSSMTLDKGMHKERVEFIITAPSEDGQALMRDYRAQTDQLGDLPFYNPDIFAATLKSGRLPATKDR